MRAASIGAISAALVTATATVVLAACSDTTSGSVAQSGLARAMDSVAGTAPARTWFSYGDLARLRRLGAYTYGAGTFHVVDQWTAIVGMGADQLANVALVLPDVTGIDIFDYDTAVSIGEPPNTAVKVTGTVPATKITQKLTSLGAKPRTFGSTQGLSFNADNKIDTNSPLTTRLHLLSTMNQVVVTAEHVAASPNSATIQAVLGHGRSLLATGQYQDVADCLGNVLAAEIFRPKNAPRAQIIAVGVRDAASLSGARTEVVCVLPAAGEQGAVRAAMHSGLALDATDPAARAPLSRWFTASKVTTAGATVRAILTVRPGGPHGYVFQAIQLDRYKSWVGD